MNPRWALRRRDATQQATLWFGRTIGVVFGLLAAAITILTITLAALGLAHLYDWAFQRDNGSVIGLIFVLAAALMVGVALRAWWVTRR